ncbi:MAG TPA: S8 family serine peptidase [Pyrinomonadaceae bacterium]|jgi:subtilisin family serine protease
MGDLKHVIVQVLDEAEKEAAAAVLKKHGDVSLSQYYVRGYGDDKDIASLRDDGFIVEHFGAEELGLRWLEPEEEEESAQTLSVEFDAAPPSPIQQVANESPAVCLIQLKGPLRTAWKEQLDQHGVQLIAYKPEYAYKAMLRGSERSVVESLDFVARIEDYQPTKRYRLLQESTKRAKITHALHEQKAKAEELGSELRDVMEGAGEKIKEAVEDRLEQEASNTTAYAESATHETEAQAETLREDVSNVLASAEEEAKDKIATFFHGMAAPAEPAASSGAAEGDPPPAADAPEMDAAAPEAEVASDVPAEAASVSADEPQMLTFEIKSHVPEQLSEWAEALKKDSRIKDVEVGRVRIRFSCLEDSPALEEISILTQVYPYVEAEIGVDFARIGIGIESEDATPLLPWKGEGIIVGVADTGVDKEHPDLKNQLLEIIARAGDVAATDENGHGTHVCGIIAGDGTASGGKLRGIASGAKLVVQGIVSDEKKFSGLPINLADLFQEAYDKGVRIHNNSWGMSVKGLYSIDSYEVDEFVYNHPDFLVIFSAGNDGRQTDEDHPDPEPELGRILQMSLFSPATSKNALTVGACCSKRKDGPYENLTWRKYRGRNPPPQGPLVADEPISGDLDYLAAFSSRGPSDDERIKPDLVAPGTVIVSARSSNAEARDPYKQFDGQYMYLSGTSQAAPIVAGAAAIVREFYIKECQHPNPSAALLKATLINGTQWIDRKTAQLEEVGQPNFYQGFGRIDLQRTLPVPGNAEGFRLLFVDVDRKDPRSLNKSISGKGRWTRKVSVEKGLPLCVTLAWTDKPGKGMQQDLDLVVTRPNGKKIVGNHFLKRLSAFPNDRRNNVEQIHIKDADLEPGTYVINVLAYNTPFEDQGFSLVVTGKLTSDFLP